MRNIDLTDQRFGHLVAIRRNGSKRNRALWECRCDCGNTTYVTSGDLRQNNTKSCGCQKNKGRLSHGDAKGPYNRLYGIWAAMKARCTNPNNTSFPNYGARGVTVCEEWKEYIPFKKWALKNGYAENLTIDRIDVNGSYSPSNCRWVTYKTQSNNTRRNRFLTANGKTQTVSEWSKETGIPCRTISARINVLGWNEADAVNRPLKGRST